MFRHGLDTVFIYAALVMFILCFRLPFECSILFDHPSLGKVCLMHSVLVIMHVHVHGTCTGTASLFFRVFSFIFSI